MEKKIPDGKVPGLYMNRLKCSEAFRFIKALTFHINYVSALHSLPSYPEQYIIT